MRASLEAAEEREARKNMTPEDEAMVEFLSDACDGEFTFIGVHRLYEKMAQKLNPDMLHDSLSCYEYLNDKYFEMARRSARTRISNRLSYLMGMITGD